MKHSSLPSLLTLIAASLAGPVLAQGPVASPAKLLVNGRLSDLAEPALVVEDHLLISGAVLAAELGVTLEGSPSGAWVLRTYGHELSLRPGDTRYRLDKVDQTAPVAPLYRGDDLFVPVTMVMTPLEITVTRGETWALQTPAACILQVRQGLHPDKVRFVLDLSGPVHFRCEEQPGKLVIEFPAAPDAEGRRKLLRLRTFDDPFAPQITEVLDEGLARVVIAHESAKPAEVLTLTDPPRIVVDLYRPATAPPPRVPPERLLPPPSGPWRSHAFTGAKGPVRAFSMQLSLRDYCWRPALAAETIMRRASVSRIARQNGAFAALNGGFFSLLGPPLGLLVVNGEWVKAPLHNRAVLGLDRDGNCAIRRLDFSGRVDFAGVGSLPLEGLNQGHTGADSVVAYTPRWGMAVTGAPGLTRLVIGADGTLAQVLTNGAVATIPEGGLVLSGNGRRAESLASVCLGTKVCLSLETSPAWPGLWQAIGGGPVLVREGQVGVSAREERFRPDVAGGPRPRSAVGLTATGDLILLAAQEPGLTLGDLAGIMAKLGARDAMNLDGGGSTAFVVQGRLLNTPSDGCERAVSNALLLFRSGQGPGGLPPPTAE